MWLIWFCVRNFWENSKNISNDPFKYDLLFCRLIQFFEKFLDPEFVTTANAEYWNSAALPHGLCWYLLFICVKLCVSEIYLSFWRYDMIDIYIIMSVKQIWK